MSEADEQRGEGEMATCHMCGQEFPTPKELSEHLMAVHDDEGLTSGSE